MFRIFSRSPLITACESLLGPVIPSGVRCGRIGQTSGLLQSSGGDRFYSCGALSMVSSRKESRGHFGLRNGGIQNGVGAPLVFYEQCRMIGNEGKGYWLKEGRVMWRRKKRIEKEQRELILEPRTPLIDYRFPLPKDNSDLIPPDLFEEKRVPLTDEEEMKIKNDIVTRINEQVSRKEEGRLFAIIHVNGKQFRVTPEDIIVIQEYFPPTVGDQIRLHKVLLVGSKDFTLVGSPVLDPDFVRVEATVIEKTMSYTKISFKMSKRLNHRRFKFDKTTYTMLRINLVELNQPLEKIKPETISYEQTTSA